MHHVTSLLYKLGGRWANFAFSYVPFFHLNRVGHYAVNKCESIELEKMITFDALTPKYDSPMTTHQLKSILEEEGFEVEHLEDSYYSPVYATARKRKT